MVNFFTYLHSCFHNMLIFIVCRVSHSLKYLTKLPANNSIYISPNNTLQFLKPPHRSDYLFEIGHYSRTVTISFVICRIFIKLMNVIYALYASTFYVFLVIILLRKKFWSKKITTPTLIKVSIGKIDIFVGSFWGSLNFTEGKVSGSLRSDRWFFNLDDSSCSVVRENIAILFTATW